MTAFLYFATVSIVAVGVCVYDKIAAKTLPRHRVPETVLLFLSMIGGSAAMLLAMLIIRHKTKHKKFMIGIPLILAMQLALCVGFVYFYYFI